MDRGHGTAVVVADPGAADPYQSGSGNGHPGERRVVGLGVIVDRGTSVIVDREKKKDTEPGDDGPAVVVVDDVVAVVVAVAVVAVVVVAAGKAEQCCRMEPWQRGVRIEC